MKAGRLRGRHARLMPAAGDSGMYGVGSTLHTGLGGLVVGILYLVFGPGALLLHGFRLGFNAWSVRARGRSTARYSDLDTAKRCLPWNVIITLVPFLPAVCQQLHIIN